MDPLFEELYALTIGPRGVSLGDERAYRETHPGAFFVKDACLASCESGPLWDGDLDLTDREEMVQTTAGVLGETVYLLLPSSAQTDPVSGERLLCFEQAVAAVDAESGETWFDVEQAYRSDDGRLLLRRAN